ncbi:hypothetical protein ACIQVR_41025 [Streptomyces xanthochromogenes]|uniref:hypothetical protein n=1 Tax=Streptomyces xanthochromogenes TaxID=67384 RepID=UPI0038000D6F
MNDLGIPEFLIEYLAQRADDRADAVTVVLASLTDRERRLVHDAAVMGYVQGMRHPQRERIPKNSRIVSLVVQECLAFPDLYPAITGYVPEPLGAQCGLSEDEHDADDCEIQADTSEGDDHA